MKTEITSAAIQNTEAKQAWTAPTLTTLSLPLETHADVLNGGDAGVLAGFTET